MNVNKYLFGLTLGILASCSNIAEDERLIYVAPAEVQRNVLIEDFTGQSCVNCPEAASLIHELQAQYGESIIAVGIYSGPFGAPESANALNLVTETGSEYWDSWFNSSMGQPVAKINRNGYAPDYGTWSGDVAKALQVPTTVGLEAEVAFNSSSNSITFDVLASGPSGESGLLQVWLTEDNIVAYQKLMTGKPDRNYVHNHVFRAAVNGTWGEKFVFSGDKSKFSYTFNAIPEDWNIDNMHAVIFVTDINKEDVKQVIQVPVKMN